MSHQDTEQCLEQALAGMLVVRGPSPSQSFVCAPGTDSEGFGLPAIHY